MRKHTIDHLATMDENELRSLFFSIKSMIDRKRSRRNNVGKLEIEMCYVQRELEIRRARHLAHKEYVASFQSRRR